MSPHDLTDLVASLGRAGIGLDRHPDDPTILRFRPTGIDAALVDRIRGSKAALLRLLVEGVPIEPGSEAEAVVGERLGVADELGMPTTPGAPAWSIAVAEAMRCDSATLRVESPHDAAGRTGEGDRAGRPDGLRDLQGGGRRSLAGVASPERRARGVAGHCGTTGGGARAAHRAESAHEANDE